MFSYSTGGGGGANMDIQFIGSVFGAVSYVCSYICKKEADSLTFKLTEAMATRRGINK